MYNLFTKKCVLNKRSFIMKKIIAMLLTVVIAVSVVFSAVVTTNAAGKKAQKSQV